MTIKTLKLKTESKPTPVFEPKPWRVTAGPFTKLTEDHLRAIGRRLDNGCPTEGVTISPWGAQLLADALNLYGHVQVLQAEQKEKA